MTPPVLHPEPGAIVLRVPPGRHVFVIADAFDATEPGHGVDMTAPLPMGHHEALRLALQRRLANPRLWTWETIAEVMAVYHGIHRSRGWWARELRKAGAPTDPRGRGRILNERRWNRDG